MKLQGFPGGSDSRESSCHAGDQVQSLCQEDPLEKEMAIHSGIHAWEMPCTEEPGGLWGSWGHKELDTTE